MVANARHHSRSHRRSRGLGGSSYIDSVVLRDRDADVNWRSASDGALDERRYYCQNWRADVSVILPSTGCDASVGPGILEWVKYSAYGVPQAFSMADYNRDGAVNGSDFNGTTGAFDVDYGASDPRADVNFDGGVTIDDYLLYINAASEAASRGTQSCASTANRIGYAGYAWDPVIGANHVRHRVYLPELGRWTRRDPLGYVDGMSVYEYVVSMPIDSVDPYGLECRRYNRCSGDGPINPPSGGNRGDRRRDPPVGGVEPGPGGPPPPPPPPQPPINRTAPCQRFDPVTGECLWSPSPSSPPPMSFSDCCALACRGYRYPPPGKTFCCNGIATFCHCDDDSRSRRFDGLRELMRLCTAAHESVHVIDYQGLCPPGNGFSLPRPSPLTGSCSHCRAWAAEANCILAGCGGNVEHCSVCNRDPACEAAAGDIQGNTEINARKLHSLRLAQSKH